MRIIVLGTCSRLNHFSDLLEKSSSYVIQDENENKKTSDSTCMVKVDGIDVKAKSIDLRLEVDRITTCNIEFFVSELDISTDFCR